MAVISFKFVLVAVLCMGLAAHYSTEGAISCGTVNSKLASCVGYLQGKGPISPACCSGVKALNSIASTTPDRQQACKCLKSASASFKVNPSIAAGLPGKCGVSIPYKISTSTNCANVK